MRLSVSQVTALFRRRREAPAPAPAPAPRRTRARSRARLALVLALPAFVLVVWALLRATGPTEPEGVDLEYAARLRVVRAARDGHPDRPLGLVVGTSRTAVGFWPERLADDRGVYWVNAGRTAAGPVLNRLMLSRFLRGGTRPAVVVLEVMPVFFAAESREFLRAQLAPADLWVARRYAEPALEFDHHLLRSRLLRSVRSDPAPEPFSVPRLPEYLPRGGYPHLRDAVTPAERATETERSRVQFGPGLRNMTVQPVADRAFRDTVRAARDGGARVVLLRAPEGPVFRSWYDPAALAEFDAYVARLASEYRVPVVDARLWLEEEDFSDSHHTLKRGAEKFTLRLARELDGVLAAPR